MKNDLLLLHGALGSEKQFESLKNQLSDHFKVHTFNFDGHGGVFTDQVFSMELFTTNTLRFIQEQGLEQVDVFGYSMGGYVGLSLARKEPSLVRSIVTLGTKFNWTKEVAAQEVKMLNPDKIVEKVPTFAKFLETLHHPNDWREVMHKTAEMMLALGAGKRMNTEGFQQITQKILIGIGTLDRMVTIEESENAAQALPNSTLKIIEGFQHPIEKVDEAKLAQIITDFLKNN